MRTARRIWTVLLAAWLLIAAISFAVQNNSTLVGSIAICLLIVVVWLAGLLLLAGVGRALHRP